MLLACATPSRAGEGIDFDTQLIPIFTKAGCNAGACHGAAIGRGGFRLSLLGLNPAADYEQIVHALEGRRINLADPAASLLLAKPTGQLDHGGGYRLEYDGDDAQTIQSWIAGGAPRLNRRRLTDFAIEPRRKILDGLGASIEPRATATFDNAVGVDSAEVDVSRWTVFTSSDPGAVSIDEPSSVATVKRRGRHIVIARYLDRVEPLELIVPLGDAPVDHSVQPRNNFIDEEIYRTLETLRLPVSPPADDATFLRRAWLDLTGTLPPPDDVRSFLEDDDVAKPARLVDELLDSEEFVSYWTFTLTRLLRIKAQPNETAGAEALHAWVREQLRRGVGYDTFAHDLLLASGDSHEYGPANFYRTAGNAREQAEFVSELFLGARLRCANCHDHPLDRWTQDDYHGLAAIFARVERGRHVRLGTRGEVTHPRTSEPAVARIPGERFLEGGGAPRESLAAWLTAEQNPYFARAIVNRLWKHLMGRGLVEPTDDLRDTNPATHPQLLARLAEDFVAHNYDLRHTLRRIASSAAYARSGEPLPGNEADAAFYSRALAKPLAPEVLADAVVAVTGVAHEYGGRPRGTRAIELIHPGVPSETLDILGRCAPGQACESPESGGGLSAKLHLVNGPFLNAKIASPEGRLRQMLTSGASNAEIVEAFYVRALCRTPSEVERRFWLDALPEDDRPVSRHQALEDFLWSLLSCREFVESR